MGCYIWYSGNGTGRAGALPSPLLAVPNVTAHTSTASVPTIILPYNRPFLCSFNVPIKELNNKVVKVIKQINIKNSSRLNTATQPKLHSKELRHLIHSTYTPQTHFTKNWVTQKNLANKSSEVTGFQVVSIFSGINLT